MPRPRTPAPPGSSPSSPAPPRRAGGWRVRAALAVCAVVAVAATGAVGVATARAYTPSPLERTPAETADLALPRLAFLRGALRDGAGEDMQTLFPEGYFFSHVLYGLAWTDVAVLAPERRDRALREARWALGRLESPAGRAPFTADADPDHGVFYAGWSAWLRGRIVSAAGGPAAAPREAERLDADADALRGAFDAALDSGTPYLAAYPGQSWPVDSVVAIAALAQHDRLTGEGHSAATVDAWTAAVDERLDTATGLIPHRVDPVDGRPLEGARGSSQTVLLRFLAEVDPARAARDHRTFRAEFASDIGMLPAVREHPRGDDSSGDVDSGPLVFGLSASASTVALGDAVVFRDAPAAAALTGFAEALGGGAGLGRTHRYLGGAVPVGDAFLVWSLTAGADHGAPRPPAAPAPAGGGTDEGAPAPWWRVPWHLAFAAVLALPWWPVLRAARRGPG